MKKHHPNQLALRFNLTPEKAAEAEPEPEHPHVHFTMSSFMAGVPKPGVSLDTARSAFRDKLNDGVSCPCCQRYAKRYRRAINATMAGALCALVARRNKGQEWVRAEEVGADLRALPAFERVSYPHGEIGKLAFPAWGLVESKPSSEPSKKNTGLWRATARGAAFVRGDLTVPKYLFVYDNHVDAVSTEEVSIRQCFKANFSYEELLR